VFDVYQGKGIQAGKKSIAIALTLRAMDRTLLDDEIARIGTVLVDDIRAHFGAEVRQ
jgi:phenylalanyl-tRNA synthetase beta chain